MAKSVVKWGPIFHIIVLSTWGHKRDIIQKEKEKKMNEKGGNRKGKKIINFKQSWALSLSLTVAKEKGGR